MVEALEMPGEAIGFRSDGEVRPIDLRNTLIPPVRRLVRAEAEIRLLLVAEDGFEQVDAGEIWSRAKRSWNLGRAHLPLLRRIAVATEVGWIRRDIRAFGWMAPAEVRLFGVAELDPARDWVCG